MKSFQMTLELVVVTINDLHWEIFYYFILKKCAENIDKLEIKYKTTYFEENKDCYLPALPNLFVNHYMPICPIWTSLILGPVISPGEVNVRYNNAIAENWMKVIKSNILNNETKHRLGDFLRKMREGLEGRTELSTLHLSL